MSVRRLRRPGIRSWVRLFLFAVVAGCVTPAGAHDILVHSSLDDGPVRAGAATVVTLRFNAKIEASLSKVSVLTRDGKAHSLQVLPGRRAGEIEVTLPPLSPGLYGLRYNVLASDGHLTDEVVRFNVTE